MGKKLYIGNLSYEATDQDLQQVFSQAGTCESAAVIMDRSTGQSRGFGFVEMSSDAEAQAAIQQLNGQDLKGRALKVNEAMDKGGGGGGNRGGGGYGGGNGGGFGRGGRR
jgi:RNA recognition motif-containing protein